MSEDLIFTTNDAACWKAAAEKVNTVLLVLDTDAVRGLHQAEMREKELEALKSAAIDPARLLFRQISNASWSSGRWIYTLGQCDTDRLILCCEKKILDWYRVFQAKSAFGTPEDVQKIYEQARLDNQNMDLTAALIWAAKPVLLTTGLRHEGNLATTEILLKMGADARYNSGGLYVDAVEQGRLDIGRAFARTAHLNGLNLKGFADNAKSNSKFKLYQDLREIYWEYGRFQPLDAETLVETKPISNSQNLKIIFNFSTRRVAEIYELAGNSNVLPVFRDFSFDDYEERALEQAKAKLEELGGHPSGIGSMLKGKKIVPRLGIDSSRL